MSSTANGFRAAVNALRSIDGDSMSIQHFTLPEDRCARLLVKKLGRGMPESAVRKELETLGIHVQGVTQLRAGRRDQNALPNPTSLYQWREGLRCPGCAQSLNSAACECRCSRTWLQRAVCNASVASASTHAAKLRLRGSVRRVWGLPPIRWVLNPAGTGSVLWLWG